MSVPPQPQPSAPGPQPPAPDGAARFGATPVWAFVTSALVTVGGAAAYVWTATRAVEATCDGEVMGPGDICQTISRTGVVTRTQSHRQMLDEALLVNAIIGWTALGLALLGIAFGVIAYLRWRQDVALAGALRPRPRAADRVALAHGLDLAAHAGRRRPVHRRRDLLHAHRVHHAGVGLPRRHPLLRRDRCRPAHRLGAEERHPGADLPRGGPRRRPQRGARPALARGDVHDHPPARAPPPTASPLPGSRDSRSRG